MATGYVRQSAADIVSGEVVRAAPLNNEFNALRDAFAATTGHNHDNTTGGGAYIGTLADVDANNKIVVDTGNNRFGVFVEVSAASVEQVRFADGSFTPVTTNDVDIGSTSARFKDGWFAGTVTAATGTFASLAASSFTGTVTFDNITATGTVNVPTATLGTNSTVAASTAFVQTAIAAVNAQSVTVVVVDNAASINAAVGQHIIVTNASTVTVTLPASPAVGDTIWVTIGNGRVDTVIARNGNNIMSLAENLTIDNFNVTVQLRYINSTIGWRLV